MTERGIVTGVSGKAATVQLEMADGCASCINEACKKGARQIQAYNRGSLVLVEGDEVELNIEGRASLIGSFWLLGLPLALLGAGYAVGRALWPSSGEGPAVLMGLGALAAGMLIGILVQKRQRLESFPSIVRKLESTRSSDDEPKLQEGDSEYEDLVAKE